MTKRLAFISGLVIIILGAMAIFYQRRVSTVSAPSGQAYAQVSLAGRTVQAIVSDTEASRELGLGFRQNLSDEQGMWFVFDSPQQYVFWMKNMNFDIDIIWVRDGQVADITRQARVQPGASDADLIRYSPSAAVDRVLELPAGWADRYGLKIGEEVKASG